MRALRRRLTNLELKLGSRALQPIPRVLPQIEAALTTREKIQLGQAEDLKEKGRGAEMTPEHRAALSRQEALWCHFINEDHVTDDELETMIANLESKARAG